MTYQALSDLPWGGSLVNHFRSADYTGVLRYQRENTEMGLKERLHGAIVCPLLPAPCIGTQRAIPYGSVMRVVLFTVVAALAVLSALKLAPGERSYR